LSEINFIYLSIEGVFSQRTTIMLNELWAKPQSNMIIANILILFMKVPLSVYTGIGLCNQSESTVIIREPRL